MLVVVVVVKGCGGGSWLSLNVMSKPTCHVLGSSCTKFIIFGMIREINDAEQ
jgi:hypothetical protein